MSGRTAVSRPAGPGARYRQPMIRQTSKLMEAIEGLLAGHGYELVDAKTVQQGRRTCLRLLIDHIEVDAAVTLGDCVKVSKALGADPSVIDLLPERHVLEVSSPGINRPLTRPAHYRRFGGEQVVIRLRRERDGKRTWKGIIAEAGDETVTVVQDGDERIEIPYDEIENAHLKVDPWKPKKKK